MKVLYVKFNTERKKQFQLKTILFEENGKKFIKKVALNEEAIPFLKRMKINYKRLSDSIINPKVKLAKILDESKDSLIFEFIDGVSFEQKYKTSNKEFQKKLIQEYKDLLFNSFKTTKFDSKSMITSKFIDVFGNINYSVFDGKICFDGISNIDLNFSNLIYKNDYIFIIDYEWVFELNLPIEYILGRTYKMCNYSNIDFNIDKIVINKMEENFQNYVNKHILNKYLKKIKYCNFENEKIVQLFIGYGNEYSEERSIIHNFNGNNIYKFNLGKNFNNINKLRLDPLNNYVIVKIDKIESDANVIFKGTNAEIIENNIFYFSTEDPQIKFEVDGNISYIIFKLMFLEIDEKKVLKKIIEKKDEILNEKTREIIEIQNELERKENEINENIKEIRKLQNIIEKKDEILNEKSLECEILKVKLKRGFNEK